MNTFNFNGIDSSQFSIMMSKIPNRPLASKRVIRFEIPGRDGHLTYDDESHQAISITVECTIMDISETNLRALKAWLQGSGNLIFSDEPDVYWKARLDTQIDFTIPLRLVHQFILQFDCFPFAYSLYNQTITLTTSPSSIVNLTTKESKPLLKIYGSGSIDLTINSNIIHLTNIVDYVTIDSELMDCYKDTQLMNNYMDGEFPELIIGTNNISWTGTVSKIEITPNWRWL